MYRIHVFLCTNQTKAKSCGNKAPTEDLFHFMRRCATEAGLSGEDVRITRTGCLGQCEKGPCLAIYPEDVWYTFRSEADVEEIVRRHLLKGERVERLLLRQENIDRGR